MSNAAVKPNADTTLVIQHTFDAPRERVFDAWLDPKQVSKWMGPRSIGATATLLEPRVGGQYRIQMNRQDGPGPTVAGVYKEIVRPERLVFSWACEATATNNMPAGETLVTITFRDVGGKTLLTLMQENFVNVDSRNSHNDGWSGSFEKLAEFLTGQPV